MINTEHYNGGEPYGYYKKAVIKYESMFKQTASKHKLFSTLRLFFFLLFVLGIWYFNFIPRFVGIPSLIIVFAAFLMSIKRSLMLKKEIVKLKTLIKINHDELTALDGNIDPFHPGKEYIDKSHPYTYDLDVFGTESLFHFLNRTCTVAGKNKLAKRLSQINQNTEDIRERQNAVKELRNKPDWRQNFIADALSGQNFEDEINDIEDLTQEKLDKWSSDKFQPVGKTYMKVLLFLLPGFVLISLAAAVFGFLSYNISGLFALINLSFIGLFLRKINHEHERLSNTVKSLKKIEILINLIENETFESAYLIRMKHILGQDKMSSALIKQLYKTLQAFDWRLNMLAGVMLNGILLWDLQVLQRLERLKKEVNACIPKWFEVLGEYDALISLSGCAFNHPEFVFPELSDEAFILKFNNGGHPLIHKDKRVDNDFEINGLHTMIIVTGANMAGKSTFLRTVNVNMILGACGAPVCASYFKFSPVSLYTSIRTDDSLSKNESYFYAELMRLKKITDELKAGKTLFITLDEMLKGTNSNDKHNGSYALIEQLIKYKASGLAATHDIQLGKLADVYPKNIENKRFEVEIIGDDLHFDYQLKDGISRNLNASFLMKKYGITE